MRLFFIPYGGGSEYSYKGFKSIIGKVDNHFVSLPGRGSRISEPFKKDIFELVDEVYKQILPHVNEPYALFGHSMGALLGFLVCRKLRSNNENLPIHLFVSGRHAPSLNLENNISNLPKKEFWNSVIKLGGVPKAAISEDNLLDFFEPILRSDLRILERFNYEEGLKLDIPITVFRGIQDGVTSHAALEWQKETKFPLQVYEFDGGHFFIIDQKERIMNIIYSKCF